MTIPRAARLAGCFDRRRRVSPLLLAAAIGLVPLTGRAETSPTGDAKVHFDRGVAAFNEQRFGEAASEFEAAYKLSPAFQVLYNIGRVNVALGRHVEAIRAFRAYLSNGGSAIPSKRRSEVEADLEREAEYVGTLVVRVVPETAEVWVDGERFGSSYNTPLAVAPGTHAVEVKAEGRLSKRANFQVRARERVFADFTLEPSEVVAPSAPPSFHSQDEAPSSSTTVAYGILVGGGLLAIAGGTLAFVGAHKANAARDEMARAKTGATYDLIKTDYDAGSTLNLIGLVTTGGGTVATGIGLLLVMTAPRPRRDGSTTVLPDVRINRNAFALSWSW
jgi:tetratricopeptide (TPR) repeat protein